MNKKSFTLIKNVLITSLITGVLIMLIPSSKKYVFDSLSWIWIKFIFIYELLIESYSLKGWILLLIISFALIGIISIYIALKGKSKNSLYIEDYIYNGKWRWEWKRDQVSNLCCFCPNCDGTLVYDDSSCSRHSTLDDKTDFICENCSNNIVSSIPGGNRNYALGAVKREINRRIRVGEQNTQLVS